MDTLTGTEAHRTERRYPSRLPREHTPCRPHRRAHRMSMAKSIDKDTLNRDNPRTATNGLGKNTSEHMGKGSLQEAPRPPRRLDNSKRGFLVGRKPLRTCPEGLSPTLPGKQVCVNAFFHRFRASEVRFSALNRIVR